MLAGVLVLLLPRCCCSPSCGCAGTAATPGSARGAARPRRPVAARCRALAGPGRPWPALRGARARRARSYSLVHWLRRRLVDRVPARRARRGRPARTLGLGAAGGRWSRSLLALPGRLARGAPPRRLSSTLLERSTYVANALPGIVVALALVTVVDPVRPGRSTRPTLLLLAAYAILFLPRAVVTRPRGARAGAAGARRRRPQPRRGPLATAAPGDPAADRARHRRRRRAGLPRGRHRADRDPAARPRSAPTRWPPSSGRHSSACAYGAAAPYALLMVLISVPATVLLDAGRRGAASR